MLAIQRVIMHAKQNYLMAASITIDQSIYVSPTFGNNLLSFHIEHNFRLGGIINNAAISVNNFAVYGVSVIYDNIYKKGMLLLLEKRYARVRH